MLAIVDVLSFSTAVDVALAAGASVLPFPYVDGTAAAAASGAILARRRGEGGFSLSPASLRQLAPGSRLLLPSPNGATLTLAAGATPVVAGCLRNARAVAAALRKIAGTGAIGVIAAGERWPDGSLRPAIEDLFGAGAILDALALPMSAEARVMRDAFRSAIADLDALMRDSVSGRELIGRGFPEDVEIALERDVSTNVPLLCEGAFRLAALD